MILIYNLLLQIKHNKNGCISSCHTIMLCIHLIIFSSELNIKDLKTHPAQPMASLSTPQHPPPPHKQHPSSACPSNSGMKQIFKLKVCCCDCTSKIRSTMLSKRFFCSKSLCCDVLPLVHRVITNCLLFEFTCGKECVRLKNYW